MALPPCCEDLAVHYYHLTGACYQHRAIIGGHSGRMAAFAANLRKTLDVEDDRLSARCVLPNPWHVLVLTTLMGLILAVERFHGRRFWYQYADRRIRSARHRFAVINYIHHNFVKHGYVSRWVEWVFPRSTNYGDAIGHDAVLKQWAQVGTTDAPLRWF